MNKTVEHLCENFNKDMEEYLKAAFPDADVCKIKEAAVYVTNRMTVSIFDVIFKRDTEWGEIYIEMLKSNIKSTELMIKELNNVR